MGNIAKCKAMHHGAIKHFVPEIEAIATKLQKSGMTEQDAWVRAVESSVKVLESAKNTALQSAITAYEKEFGTIDLANAEDVAKAESADAPRFSTGLDFTQPNAQDNKTQENKNETPNDRRSTTGTDGRISDGSGLEDLTTVGGGKPRESWATATRIRGKNGPLASYRGAALNLEPSHFDEASLGKNSGNPSSGLGVWTTTHYSEAKGYHDNVQKVYLDVRNPKDYTFDGLPAFKSSAAAYAFQQKLKAEGFDGIRIRGDHLGKKEVHFVVFDPHQVIPVAPNAKASVAAPGEISGNTTDKIRSTLLKLFQGARGFDKLVTVVQTAEELPSSIRNSKDFNGRVQGVAHAGKVYLVADNLSKGEELAVFLHEAGGHLGFDKIMNAEQRAGLAGTVRSWVYRKDAVGEAARAALERGKESNDEIIAYAVEELVNRGVTPQGAKAENSWLRTVIGAFKDALHVFGMTGSLNPQQLVDMAYGAAHLELNTAREATSPEPARMSVKTEPNGVVDQSLSTADIWNKFGDFVAEYTPGIVQDGANKVKVFGLGGLSLSHLSELAKDVNPAVADYDAVTRKIGADTKRWVERAAAIDAKWANVKDAEALSGVMRETTKKMYDPTADTPKTAEQIKLRTAYNRLSPEAKAVYVQARDYYKDHRKTRQDIMDKLMDEAHAAALQGAKGDVDKMAALEKTHESNKAAMAKMYASVSGPYFPLMRLGEFYINAKSAQLVALEKKEDAGDLTPEERKQMAAMRQDEKHFRSETFTHLRDAKKAAALLRKTHVVKDPLRVGEHHNVERVMTAAGMKGVVENIDATFKGMENGASIASKLQGMMADMYFQSLPEHHYLKREMRREGVAGEEKDMRRVFARSSIQGAHYVGRLAHAEDLKTALFKAKELGTQNGLEAQEYYNEVAKRASLALERDDMGGLIAGINNMSYLSHFALSPMFLLTNASQVPMVTVPWLAARTSTAAATVATSKAYAKAAELIVTSIQETGWRSELNWKDKVTPGQSDMLQSLLDRGLLNITMEHDLGAVAEMKNQTVRDKLQKINLPIHVTELANRAVSALAIYDLAITPKAKGGMGLAHKDAVSMAERGVSETQLDYSALNSPRHMQRVMNSAALAKLVMQFRRYQQGMLWLIGRNTFQAIAGEDADTRRVARRMLFGLGVTTASAAGSLGLPMVGSALALASMIASVGGDDDEDVDYARDLRDWAADTFGETAAVAFTNGLPAALLNLDMNKRVGLGDIASPLPYAREGKTSQETLGNTLVAAAGAGLGNAVTMYDGLKLMMDGQWVKGSEKFVPLKFVKNLLQGYRYQAEGMTRPNGEVILPPDEFSVGDLGIKYGGGTTMTETLYHTENAAVNDLKYAVQDEAKRLTDTREYQRRNGEDTSGVDEDIAEFKSRHPGVIKGPGKQHRQWNKNENNRAKNGGVLLQKKDRAYGQDNR